MSKVIWLTGLSGAGKTTLSHAFVDCLKERNLPVELLDGDEVRDFFEGDLGFTREARIMNVRRVAFGAYLLAKNDIYTVVANIAPYYEVRDFIRKKLGSRYVQVYVKASLSCVKERDVKGHYLRYEQNKEKELIGIDNNYDIPRSPDLVIDSENEEIEFSKDKILDFMKNKFG